MKQYNREMSLGHTTYTVDFRMCWAMNVKRFVVLMWSLLMVTLLAAFGMVESPDGPFSAGVIAIVAIGAVLLIFGVEIDRIEFGSLKILFSKRDESDDE